MKTKILMIAVIMAALFSTTRSSAQVSININIGSQPLWGPTGYDHVDNYYFPDMDVFYNVQQAMFYYSANGQWISGPSLPPQYGNVDIYNTYKVVVNKPEPWHSDATYRKQYSSYRGRHNQPMIRDSHDQRYYANPQHPMHKQWDGKTQANQPRQNVHPRQNTKPNNNQPRGNENHSDDNNNRGQGNNHGGR